LNLEDKIRTDLLDLSVPPERATMTVQP